MNQWLHLLHPAATESARSEVKRTRRRRPIDYLLNSRAPGIAAKPCPSRRPSISATRIDEKPVRFCAARHHLVTVVALRHLLRDYGSKRLPAAIAARTGGLLRRPHAWSILSSIRSSFGDTMCCNKKSPIAGPGQAPISAERIIIIRASTRNLQSMIEADLRKRCDGGGACTRAPRMSISRRRRRHIRSGSSELYGPAAACVRDEGIRHSPSFSSTAGPPALPSVKKSTPFVNRSFPGLCAPRPFLVETTHRTGWKRNCRFAGAVCNGLGQLGFWWSAIPEKPLAPIHGRMAAADEPHWVTGSGRIAAGTRLHQPSAMDEERLRAGSSMACLVGSSTNAGIR